MRALLMLASLLTACETTWQVHQGPNPSAGANRHPARVHILHD